MNASIHRYYQQFRQHSMRASYALHAARTLDRFEELQAEGKVALRAEPEHENYFDVYGEPDTDKERQAICDAIERDGCWWVTSETSCPCCGSWEHADSIGMCVCANPCDPFDNWYVPDLMAAALAAYDEQQCCSAA